MVRITELQHELLRRAAGEPITDAAAVDAGVSSALIKRRLLILLPAESNGGRLIITRAGLAVLAVADAKKAGKAVGGVGRGKPSPNETRASQQPERGSRRRAPRAADPVKLTPAAPEVGAPQDKVAVFAAKKGRKAAASAGRGKTSPSKKPASPQPERTPRRRAPGAPEPVDLTAGAPEVVPPKGKLGALAILLGRPEGASLKDMMAATGWQAHSVRGAMSGSLKKKLGYAIVSQPALGGRVYRITPAPAAESATNEGVNPTPIPASTHIYEAPAAAYGGGFVIGGQRGQAGGGQARRKRR